MISDYFDLVERKIIVDRSLDFKIFSYDEGMIRGKIVFLNGYVLEFTFVSEKVDLNTDFT